MACFAPLLLVWWHSLATLVMGKGANYNGKSSKGGKGGQYTKGGKGKDNGKGSKGKVDSKGKNARRGGRRGRVRARDKPGGRKGRTFEPNLSDGFLKRDERTIFIGKMPAAVDSKQTIVDAFEAAFGVVVTHVHIQRDRKFGFAHFEDEASADGALAVGVVDILGEEVELKAATKQKGATEETMQLNEEADEDADGDQGDEFGEEGEEEDLNVDAEAQVDEVEDDQAGADSNLAEQDKDPSDAIDEAPKASDADPLADFWAERENEPRQDKDPLGNFWESRDRKNSDEGDQNEDVGDAESHEAVEERILGIRDAAIACLEAKDGQLALNVIGSNSTVKDQKRLLTGVNMFELIKGFPENFEIEERDNGQHLVTLRSIDPPNPDALAVLVDKCVANTGKYKKEKEKDQTKATSEAYRAEWKNAEWKKGRDAYQADPPRKLSANSVVEGELSDGWKERDDRTIWIGYVPPVVRSKLDVALAFQERGFRVSHVHVQSDRKFGFVHFETERDALAAMDLRSIEICGARVDVKTAGGRKRARSPPRNFSRGPPDRDMWDRRAADNNFHRGPDRDWHRGGDRDFYRAAGPPVPSSGREREADRNQLGSPIRSPGSAARPIGMPGPRPAPATGPRAEDRRPGTAAPRPTQAPHLARPGPAPAAIGAGGKAGGRASFGPSSTPMPAGRGAR